MGKFNSLLGLRLKQKESLKVTSLSERATQGNLSGFSGIFKLSTLTENEKNKIISILQEYKKDDVETSQYDLEGLLSITTEVKSINTQAILLHGERIKKAQTILKNYKDGAFSAWLFSTYGNRQTPYNFLQYYEFYNTLPKELHSKLDEMPKQAIYTLASRAGAMEKKESIVKNYEGEPKKLLLSMIRKTFPLSTTDQRLPNVADQTIASLEKIITLMDTGRFKPSQEQKEKILTLIKEIKQLAD